MKSKTITQRGNAGRKPIRPIERQKMRPWLVNLLNEDVPSLQWEVKREGTFRISWRHAARQGWNPVDDADLFERWARHTGKFMDGDDPDPKRWKANFRCALNSLPDVEELKNKGLRKGNNAFKIYRFLDEKKYKLKCRQNSNSRVTACTPKRISKRLQGRPHRRFTDSESDDDIDMSDSDECHSPTHPDSDEVSTSGSELEWLSERRSCRLSTDSSELPVFTKICGESDLSIFQNNRKYQEPKIYQHTYQDRMTFPDPMVTIKYEDDDSSSGSDMTEAELVELILNVESPGTDIEEINEEDIWSSVAADVTIGNEMETDNMNFYIKLEETKNVITEQIRNNGDMIYTSIDPSLL